MDHIDFDLREVTSDTPGFEARLEKAQMQIDGMIRSYYLYIGKPFVVANPVVFVFAPDCTDVEEFAKQSGWLEVSKKYGFVLVFPEPEAGKWDLTGENDTAFWDKLHGLKDIRYQPHNTRQYIAGYGTGAGMAERAVLRTPEFFAGIALIDPPELGQAFLEKEGERTAPEYNTYIEVLGDRPKILTKEAEQNIMIYSSEKEKLKETVAFWEHTGLEPSPFAGVRFEDKDKAEPEHIFADFFNKTRRYRIAPNGRLRAASDYRENPNAKIYYKEIAGYQREWVEVLPSDYDPSKLYPLVMMLHGSNNDGPQMYDISRLWEVAEQRKFIVLFPTSMRKEKQYNAWNFYRHTPDDNGNPDPEFLTWLIAHYKENYSVDRSRIYLSGFSNGGGMANYMAMNYPEIFAAVMPYSGAMKNEDYFPKLREDRPYMPIWVNRGSLEYKPLTLSVIKHLQPGWEYWMKWNHVDPEKYVTIDEEKMTTKIFEGTVECRYSLRKDAHHAIFSEHYWDIYDNFFARFQRGEDGSSIENGYTHLCRINGRYGKLSESKRIDGIVYISREEAEAVFGALPESIKAKEKNIDGKLYFSMK